MIFFLPFFSNVTLWQTSTPETNGRRSFKQHCFHQSFSIHNYYPDDWQMTIIIIVNLFVLCVCICVSYRKTTLTIHKEKISQAIHFVCDLFFPFSFLDIFLFHRILKNHNNNNNNSKWLRQMKYQCLSNDAKLSHWSNKKFYLRILFLSLSVVLLYRFCNHLLLT